MVERNLSEIYVKSAILLEEGKKELIAKKKKIKALKRKNSTLHRLQRKYYHTGIKRFYKAKTVTGNHNIMQSIKCLNSLLSLNSQNSKVDKACVFFKR